MIWKTFLLKILEQYTQVLYTNDKHCVPLPLGLALPYDALRWLQMTHVKCTDSRLYYIPNQIQRLGSSNGIYNICFIIYTSKCCQAHRMKSLSLTNWPDFTTKLARSILIARQHRIAEFHFFHMTYTPAAQYDNAI